MESYRKPYVREVKRTWWLANGTYIKYMCREFTAVLSLLVSLELLCFCLIAALSPWRSSALIASVIQNPAVIAFNIVALAAILFHTVTWFAIIPKAVRVFRPGSGEETRLVPARFWFVLLWLVMLAASAVVALALIFAV